MTGQVLASKIIEEYDKLLPSDLAKQAGCPIVFEKWHPVTYGEFDKKKRTIYINLSAPIPFEEIIAHELGHFFIQKYGYVMSRLAEEKMAKDFAETIIRIQRSSNTLSMTKAYAPNISALPPNCDI